MIDLIYNDEEFIFSGESSGIIADEQQEFTGHELEDFWQQLINLFI